MANVRVYIQGSIGRYDQELGRYVYHTGNTEVPADFAKALGLTPLETQDREEVIQESSLTFEQIPHREELEDNGIYSLEDVPVTHKDLIELDGIGGKRAEDILDYLGLL